MICPPGNRHDFDNWAAKGATGWSYREVLPYFMRSEDNRDPDVAYNGYHGRGGPLTVQRSVWRSPLARAFAEAGRLFGRPELTLEISQINLIFRIQDSRFKRAQSGGRLHPSSDDASSGPMLVRESLPISDP